MLEIGVGTGCISISLALEINNINIDAIDSSRVALNTATKNIKYYKCEPSIKTYLCNILESIPNNKYDVILSNPPYIPLSQVETLDQCVKNHEPIDALTDYEDGMKFYRRIKDLSGKILNQNGFIILEFGDKNQSLKIIDIFSDFKYEIFNDNTGSPRIIILEK